MGKALRSERLQSGLINVHNRTRRGESPGKPGSILVFIFLTFCLMTPVAGQESEPDVSALPPATAERLRSQIASDSVEVKRTALLEIRNLRNADASRIALPALRDRDPIVRATAPASVIFMPSNEAAAALIPLLDDRDEFVRREAAYALGDVGDPSATSPLLRLMQRDKALEVKTAVAVALGKNGDTAAIEGLMAILRMRPREEDEFLRRSAARSIGQIAQILRTGRVKVVTPQNFLPDRFKNLESPNVTYDPNRFSKATDALISVLRNTSESDDTRREAAFAIGAIGDPRSVPILRTYVTAQDPYLAEIAREALLKIEAAQGETQK